MLTIAALSQKGGVGKSTLSRLIARTYADAGWRVKIADFNLKQKTSTDWAAMRAAMNIEPSIAAEAFSSVKEALRQDYDLLVFDGRPDSDTSTLDIAKNAELILIPTGPSLDDLAPQVRFAHELVSRGINRARILFVLNKATESRVAISDAQSYIQEAGYQVAETILHMKTGYQMAQNSGKAISETDFSSLNERASAIAQECVDRLSKLKRK